MLLCQMYKLIIKKTLLFHLESRKQEKEDSLYYYPY